MRLIKEKRIDYRAIPKIMVCGRGTADEFAQYGLHAGAQPAAGFSAAALAELAKEIIKPGEKVLRVRSDKAGPQLADAIRKTGADVEDAVIYDNERIVHDELPEFDAVFFASASAVESFIEQWGPAALSGKTTCVIGQPTAHALEKQSIVPDIIAREATGPGAIQTLAEHLVSKALLS